MKLRTKINLYTAVMFIGLLLLINVASYIAFSKLMLNSELERTALEASQTIEDITQANTTVPLDDLLRAYVPINGMLQIVREDGTASNAVTARNHQNLKSLPDAFQRSEKKEIITVEGIPHAFVSTPIIWSDGNVVELQIIEDLSATDRNIQRLQLVLIVVTAIATIPVIISTNLLSNFITRPITSMIKTMREIRKSGEYKRIQLPKQAKDELYQMGETFNEMMDLLEDNFEKQEQFVSNASHELKTPLTVIESYSNLLKRRGMEDKKVAIEAVDAIHSEAIRMKELTEQLLFLARHNAQWKIEPKRISINKIVEESRRSFETGFNREVKLIQDENLTVKTDEQKLKQLVYILMDNARKYSEDDIIVRVYRKDNKAVIEIVDKGIGIPSEDLEKVFDRFYRVDKSRTRNNGGYGLGLSLAKDIADALDAEIRLDSVERVGTTAQIILELINSQ